MKLEFGEQDKEAIKNAINKIDMMIASRKFDIEHASGKLSLAELSKDSSLKNYKRWRIDLQNLKDFTTLNEHSGKKIHKADLALDIVINNLKDHPEMQYGMRTLRNELVKLSSVVNKIT